MVGFSDKNELIYVPYNIIGLILDIVFWGCKYNIFLNLQIIENMAIDS
jgi:hypothetical protein